VVLSYWFAIVVLKGLSALPLKMGYRCGAMVGRLTFHLSPRRRHVAQKNIQACFPQITESDQKDLVKQVFVESGVGLVESSWVWFKQSSKIVFRVDEESRQNLRDAVARGKGVLLLCPHFTTLELSAVVINQIVGRFVITYRPQDSESFDKIICDGRAIFGDLVNVRDLRAIVSALRRGRVVWFGPDQDMGPRGSVFADFFGIPACTVTTPARLARATDCEVVFCSIYRERAQYQVRFSVMSDAYPCENEVANARELNKQIEKAIDRSPAQYMWMHRRFKTNPDGSRHGFYE
jgi:Kdo2-lipid IVA lauroyltransferase/acyltransferase